MPCFTAATEQSGKADHGTAQLACSHKTGLQPHPPDRAVAKRKQRWGKPTSSMSSAEPMPLRVESSSCCPAVTSCRPRMPSGRLCG